LYLKNIEWYIKHRNEEEMPTSSIFEDIVISSEYAKQPPFIPKNPRVIIDDIDAKMKSMKNNTSFELLERMYSICYNN